MAAVLVPIDMSILMKMLIGGSRLPCHYNELQPHTLMYAKVRQPSSGGRHTDTATSHL